MLQETAPKLGEIACISIIIIVLLSMSCEADRVTVEVRDRLGLVPEALVEVSYPNERPFMSDYTDSRGSVVFDLTVYDDNITYRYLITAKKDGQSGRWGPGIPTSRIPISLR